MKKLFLLLVMVILLAGCSSSPSPAKVATLTMEAALSEVGTKMAFQNEVAKTVIAGIHMTEQAMPTSTPTITPSATFLPHLPPMNTPLPDEAGLYNYGWFLERGACGESAANTIGNPKDIPNCIVTSLEEIPSFYALGPQRNWEINFEVSPGIYEFCTLYQLEGGDWVQIATDIDSEHTGTLSCRP